MKLNDYPTPRTLAFRKQHGGCWNFRETELLHEHAQLERESAAWRDVAELAISRLEQALKNEGRPMSMRVCSTESLLFECRKAHARLLAETNKTDEHSA